MGICGTVRGWNREVEKGWIESWVVWQIGGVDRELDRGVDRGVDWRQHLGCLERQTHIPEAIPPPPIQKLPTHQSIHPLKLFCLLPHCSCQRLRDFCRKLTVVSRHCLLAATNRYKPPRRTTHYLHQAEKHDLLLAPGRDSLLTTCTRH